MVRTLALGFEDDLQEASEVAIRPAFLLEPAEIFRGEFVERTTFETAEGHGPGAELFPVGGGLGEVHGEVWGGDGGFEISDLRSARIGRLKISYLRGGR